jgi:hypothetical protein
MSHTSIETPHRKRCPMSAEQRAKLSLAQRAPMSPMTPAGRSTVASWLQPRRPGA